MLVEHKWRICSKSCFALSFCLSFLVGLLHDFQILYTDVQIFYLRSHDGLKIPVYWKPWLWQHAFQDWNAPKWLEIDQNNLRMKFSRLNIDFSSPSSDPLHRVSEKSGQDCFSHNFVKFLLNLIFFGIMMAKTMKLCKMHSFSTSPHLCQCTTMWNIDVPNCCITPSYFSSKRCSNLIKCKINLSVNYLAEL